MKNWYRNQELGAAQFGPERLDPAVVFFDYRVVSQAEPQPGALTDRFGGKKGIKNAVDHFARNAVAVVADGQAAKLSGARMGMPLRVLRGKFRQAGADRDHAALGHGVARVQSEVDENLV